MIRFLLLTDLGIRFRSCKFRKVCPPSFNWRAARYCIFWRLPDLVFLDFTVNDDLFAVWTRTGLLPFESPSASPCLRSIFRALCVIFLGLGNSYADYQGSQQLDPSFMLNIASWMRLSS